MLFLMVSWLVLGSIFFLIGINIFNFVKTDFLDRSSDRLIIAIWLGMVIVGILLTLASLILPLSFWIILAVFIILLVPSLLSLSIKQEFVNLINGILREHIFDTISLTVFVAAYIARTISWYDAGLYHHQVIQWLSRFGTIPGLALIHTRFGFTSSWFSLNAPFNTGLVETRNTAFMGGFLCLLTMFQFINSIVRLWNKQNQLQDSFTFWFLLLCLPAVFAINLPLSQSPDLPVMLLIGIIGWIVIAIATSNPQNQEVHHFDRSIIPLFLALGAGTIKLSAIPLVIGVSVFYLQYQRFTIKSMLTLCLTSGVLLFPTIVSSIVTSGCPLFPSPFLCLDLPWSVGTNTARNVSTVILEWNRWTGPTPAYANSWNWISPWLKPEAQTAIYVVLSAIAFMFLTQRRNRGWAGQGQIMTLGILGITYMLYAAPTLRFGLGYLCLIPAYGMATFLQYRHHDMHKASKHEILPKNRAPKSTLKLVIIFPLILWVIFLQQDSRNFLLPPDMQNPSVLSRVQVNNVFYFTPGELQPDGSRSDDRCWAAPLPCTPEQPLDIQLRVPEIGIGAGFVRSQK